MTHINQFRLAEQSAWDPVQFDPENGYAELDLWAQKGRPSQWHVAKAAGKLLRALGTVGEDLPESDVDIVEHEVMPDLAIYRNQLINIFL